MYLRVLILAVVGAAVATVHATAHHSHNNYATVEFTVLEGTVKEVHYLNPHSWIYMEVNVAGTEPVLWAMEATGPRGLEGNGITRDDVKVGDTIKVRCHRSRDSSNGCLLGFVTPTHGDMARGHGVEKEWD
jgi:hypothetical protein